MSDTLRAALLFLVNTIFNLYLFILMLRVILVWVKSDYFNPITQLVVKLTNAIIIPTRKILPTVGYLEISTLFIALLIECVKFYIIASLNFGMPNIMGLPILAGADMIQLVVNIFTYAIFIQVILSWIQPGSPMIRVFYLIASPILQPIRRLVPMMSGIDISPLPALILLQLISIVLVGPLLDVGHTAAFS